MFSSSKQGSINYTCLKLKVYKRNENRLRIKAQLILRSEMKLLLSLEMLQMSRRRDKKTYLSDGKKGSAFVHQSISNNALFFSSKIIMHAYLHE